MSTSASASSSASAPLMLSVSGARGIVGKSMTPAVASDFAAAFAAFIRSRAQNRQPLVCVGRDSRPSGAALAQAAMDGLAGAGCRVIDLGVVATPSVSVMIGIHHAAGGMVITASHNPSEWNGLKCLNADGAAPPPDDAHEIIRHFEAIRATKPGQSVGGPPFRVTSSGSAGPQATSFIERDDTANERHVQRVLAQVDVAAIRAARFRVILDSVNGAGCVCGRMLLESLGCDVIHLNGEPHGRFAHPPEPTEANLTDLAAQVKTASAACGFAQDPDADRLAIVDETGLYMGEECTLVLAAKRVLDRSATSRDRTGAELILAANLSTSRMLDDLAARYPGVRVLRTAVGEANVVAAMKAYGSAALVGGEGNGGVIFPSVCWVRDSLSAMALVLELIVFERRSLSPIAGDLPRYSMIKHKLDLAKLGGTFKLAPALEKLMRRFANARISTLDGVRLDFDDGWVHLRPSNTEPIVRLIAEARTEIRARELIDEVAVVTGMK